VIAFRITAACFAFFMASGSFAQSALNFNDQTHQKPGFRPNQGQWGEDFSHVIYLSRYAAFLTPDGIALGMNPIDELKSHHDNQASTITQVQPISYYGFYKRYIGINQEAQSESVNESTLIRNYFLGSDASKWFSGVKDAESIVKKEAFPGVDIHYSVTKKGSLEFDYILHPGSLSSNIVWTYDGVEPTIVKNELVYETPYGTIRERIPAAFQEINGTRISVEVLYVQEGNNFSFSVGEYNSEYDLVIDPEIVAATLTGTIGSSNYGHGATYDEAGNVFSYGRSFGVGLPTSPGAVQPTFLGPSTNSVMNKFNPDGSEQIYATYLGGGNGETLPHSASTNIYGDVFMFGSTGASNFPVTQGAFQTNFGGNVDIYISRISPDGTELIGSTYLGGSGIDGLNQLAFGYDSYRGEVSINQQGDVFVASLSASANFPVTAGAYSGSLNGNSDGIVAKLDGGLTSLAWSTFLGGESDDMVYGVRIADNGNVVISGGTFANTFPTTTGAYQSSVDANSQANAVAAVLNPQGSQLLYSTYLATNFEEHGFFVDLDNDDNVWIYGRTSGGNEWPVTDGVFTTEGKSLFIVKLNPQLSQILLSTCIGPTIGNQFPGSIAGSPVAFLVDRCDRVYISIYAAVEGMPLSTDAIFTTGGFYVAAFTENLTELGFSTYYSGNHVDGGTSRFDKKGIVYQGVCTIGGFNTTADAYATTQSDWDIGVFKIDFDLTGVNAAISAPSDLDGCAPHIIQFENYSTGDTYQWDFGDGSPVSSEFNPAHEFTSPGTYNITMIVSDSLSCNLADTVVVTINIFSPTDFAPSFTISLDCEMGSVNMVNTTGGQEFLDFYWLIDGDTLYNSYNASHQFGSFDEEHIIGLHAVDEGCNIDETFFESLLDIADVEATIGQTSTTVCGLEISFTNLSTNAMSYLWNFGDGNTSTAFNPTHTFDTYGTYNVNLSAQNMSTCNQIDQTNISITFVEPPTVNTAIQLQQSGPCEEMIVAGNLTDMTNISGVIWMINGQEVGGGNSFSTAVNSAGSYDVVALVEPGGCPIEIIFTTSIDVIREIPVAYSPERAICFYASELELKQDSATVGAQYLWAPNGESSPSITVYEPGTYTVLITTEQCFESRSFEIGFGDEIFSSFEMTICEGVNHLVDVPVAHNEFLWETGIRENPIYVNRSGLYKYTFIDLNGCEQAGEVFINGIDPDPLVFIPNAFTPNHDGINDLFKISSASLDLYEMLIFNIWGELIYESENGDQGWNGSVNGGNYYAETGIYNYIIRYRGVCEAEIIQKFGSVTLIR